MQTLACSIEGKPVRADQASREELYTCFECGEPLRLRFGRRRRPHFYHFGPSVCRHRARSTLHFKIQNFFIHQLAPEKILLEHPFPTIRRIADLVWPAKKWIFEIQCSPISAREVEERMRDYTSVGYQVIWILFDRQFKRPYLSDAELFLQQHPYYFISKELFLYQQLFKLSGGRRLASSRPFPIHIKTLDINHKREWLPALLPQKKFCFYFGNPLLTLLEKMTN